MKLDILPIVVGTGFISLTGNLRKESRIQEILIAGNGFGRDQRWEAALSALAYTMYVYSSSGSLTQLHIYFHRSYTASTASAMPIMPFPKSTIALERFG